MTDIRRHPDLFTKGEAAVYLHLAQAVGDLDGLAAIDGLRWPDKFTDEQVKVFVKSVEKLQPDAVLAAMDEHFVSGRFRPKPGDIIQRALNGSPSKSLRDLDADERCRQRVEEFDVAANAWADTVTDWDLESLREQMIAKRSVPEEVAAMWRKKNPRLSRGLLRMVFEFANEMGVVR